MGIIAALSFVHIGSEVVGGFLSTILSEIGLKSHFDDFDRGVIDTKHIVYFLSVTAVFLFLAIRALEFRRWK